VSQLTDPVAVFRAAVAALNREDWAGAAALCDPASLADVQRQLLAQFAPREITAEYYLRYWPRMPREVAEYHAAECRAQADPSRRLERELAGVPDVDALAAMRPEVVFAAWLAGRSPRRQFERQAAEGRASPGAVARALAGVGSSYDHVALGAVPEGEGLSHVLYRPRVGGPTAPTRAPGLAGPPDADEAIIRDLAWRVPPQIATCRRQPDGGWRLVATYDFLGVSSTFFEAADPPAREGAA
jgi:hypothetical protein